ncbi:MAG: hexose kinase [Solirubrobacteraceae bacterium]
MILSVTLNLAVDVTYHVDHLRRSETTRVDRVGRRAGGKGANVARVLRALGREVALTGFAGGFTGAAARAELASTGIADETIAITGESRLTFMLVEDDGTATGFSELGPEISVQECEALLARYRRLVESAEAVVVSGSLPRGVPSDIYGRLIESANRADVPTLLDADGAALEQALAAHPRVVKINAAELAGVVRGVDVVTGAAQLLRRSRAEAVVISEGADGMTCVMDGRALHVAPPRELRGNPTGAGDAASAALITGLIDRIPWSERLVDAAALSAAAVAAPLAGSFHPNVYEDLRGRIVARELPAGS